MKLDFETASTAAYSTVGSEKNTEFASDSAGISQMLAEGIEAARNGDFNRARFLLAQVSEAEPDNEDAWLWLASISQYPEELLAFLNNVLTVNPKNQRALQWSAATKAALAKSFVGRGIDASEQNQINFARQCFLQAVAYEPENETAWLRLAALSTEKAEKHAYLEKVLRLNPENETAFDAFKIVQQQIAQSPEKLKTAETSRASAQVSERLPEIYDEYEIKESPVFGSAGAEEISTAEEKLPSYFETEQPIEVSPESPAEPKNKRILIVDDSATVRKLIFDKLENSGHEILCAADGVEALEMINRTIPDLVLLDVVMPQMDGYQVCKLIRADEKTKDVPVVMISGNDGFFDKVRGRLAGASGYITKPFGPDALMKTIESYILEDDAPV